MFTWNFRLVSKARLIDTFNQLKLDSRNGDILIRIHTAEHTPEEAVQLADFLKELVPGAKIFGTSTSAIIIDGKIIKNQCLISVTQISRGSIDTALIPAFDSSDNPLLAREICNNIRFTLYQEDTKMILAFLPLSYLNYEGFIEECNNVFPGVKMSGGLVDGPGSSIKKLPDNAFIFDEKGWTNKHFMVASFNGNDLEALSAFATGVEAIGSDMEITDSYGNSIIEINNVDIADYYDSGIGDLEKFDSELKSLFPFVYSDEPEFPVFFHFYDNVSFSDFYPESEHKDFYKNHPDIDPKEKRKILNTNHNVKTGRKFKKAFMYDKKIISDNRALYRKVESFKKNETIFAYSCIVRSVIYSNCVKWEISAYENSNMSGCITYGEIVCVNGVNKFVSGSFTVTIMGEDPAIQEFNPFAFQYTEALADENEELLNFLTGVELSIEKSGVSNITEDMKKFIRECEKRVLSSEKTGLPNLAALILDIKIRGMDRLCIIDVPDITSMRSVFSEQVIRLTFSNYISKCEAFAKQHNYKIYMLSGWRIVIGAPSYMVALSGFILDMEALQRKLFHNIDEYIPIVPIFSILDNCTVDNYYYAYNSTRIKMTQKNIQFNVSDAMDVVLDDDLILERYRMVKVINYALENDKVIPHYQGIYDNNKKCIHHYEALMRLEDETGRIYYPGSFLEVARSYGLLYDAISRKMIEKVFEKFKDSKENSVSINIGMRDIRNAEMVSYIFDFLSTAEYPENFIFELLENEDIDDYNVMIDFVDKIHELGGKISIDDFGSGFSNLQHIINLHSDIVKIDGSIVKNCCINPGAENLIALISTWKGLSGSEIKIVAEFVENEAIQNKLLNYDIDFSQGYLFSKPSPDINI